jgi:hypothetical protein
MPSKGESCRPGRFLGSISDTDVASDALTLPTEARRILRAIDSAAPKVRGAFDSAARLYQAAAVLGRYYPTAGLAYRVAAVEAASAGDSTAGHFAAFVRKHVSPRPDLEKQINYLYGVVRSAHFHAGAFPLGEFDRPAIFDLVTDPMAAERSILQCFKLVREAIITWVASLLPPQPADGANEC